MENDKIYKHLDLVLGGIKLPNPCPVYLKITTKEIFLTVGQRDFVWDKKSGELTDTGCWVGELTEEDVATIMED